MPSTKRNNLSNEYRENLLKPWKILYRYFKHRIAYKGNKITVLRQAISCVKLMYQQG